MSKGADARCRDLADSSRRASLLVPIRASSGRRTAACHEERDAKNVLSEKATAFVLTSACI